MFKSLPGNGFSKYHWCRFLKLDALQTHFDTAEVSEQLDPRNLSLLAVCHPHPPSSNRIDSAVAASIFHPVCPSQGMSYVLKKTGWKIEPPLHTKIKVHPWWDVPKGMGNRTFTKSVNYFTSPLGWSIPQWGMNLPACPIPLEMAKIKYKWSS